MEPIFINDAIVLGILIAVLAAIIYSSGLDSFKRFYTFVPALLLCYFVPALLHYPLGLISPHWFTDNVTELFAQHDISMTLTQLKEMSYEEICRLLEKNEIDKEMYGPYTKHSNLYYMASRYLLPASLVLLCLSIDIKGILNLGPKALIMFLAGTLGIVIGGPIALLITTYLFPNLIDIHPDELWRGLSTVAGSWIGGGANQTAMKEIFEVKDNLFGSMIVVDVIVANIWMAFLLYGAGITDKIDARLGADNSAIVELKKKVSEYRAKVERNITTTHLFTIAAVAFGGVALAHWGADFLSEFMKQFKETLASLGMNSLMSHFFWLIVICTTFGFILSFTKAKELEGVGASKFGSLFIYILVATIGMKMNIGEIFSNLGLFAIGLIWMLIHVIIMILTAIIFKAPFFYVAVGSQANVGGAASAPIVASAFDTSLAPVGVLMAVLGYALGTYGALVCAWMMSVV